MSHKPIFLSSLCRDLFRRKVQLGKTSSVIHCSVKFWNSAGILMFYFQVSVSDEELEDLKKRLESARYGEDLMDTEFQYGFPVR